jgi:hypothetical protein
MNPDLAPLAALLHERLAVIADHPWRDRDPAAHLEKLKQVSLDILALSDSLKTQFPPRLAHFMDRASYDKALAFIEDQPIDGPH